MQKIASPQQLTDQLQTLVRMASVKNPSRVRLAAELYAVADALEGRTAAESKTGSYDPFTVDKIRKLTSQNHHSEAYVMGSQMLGYRVLAKKFGLLAELHNLEGHLPRHLGNYRNELYDQLMKLAKRDLAPEEWQDFYSAF